MALILPNGVGKSWRPFLGIHFVRPPPDTLTDRIKTVTGVAETGLFTGLCHRVIVGHPDETTSEAALGYTAV